MKFVKFLFSFNEELRNYQAHATRWQVIKFRVRQGFRIICWAVILATTHFVTGTVSVQYFPSIVHAKEIVMDSSLREKINELKGELLDTLKSCESRDKTEEDAVIVFDTNNKPSIGLYQFQINTVIHYYDKLYRQTITRKQAVEIALDEEKSRTLAQDVIFESGSGLKDWVNCDKKHGLTAQLNFIHNKLEK